MRAGILIATAIASSAVVEAFVAPASHGAVSVSATKAAASRSSACAARRTSSLSMAAEAGRAGSQVDQAQPTLEQWITFAEPKLQKTMIAMFAACKEIAYKIRTASCDKMACFNEFGDEQLAIDVLANNVIFENLKASGAVATASSEETPVEDPMGGSGYSVAFDPLDGSSIIDTNFAVGTIFGVWPGDRLVGISGRQLAGAGMAVYGPRTTMTIALEGEDYSHEFLLVDDFSGRHGQWVKTNTFSTIEDGKLFAPGNLRGTQDNPGYAELFKYYLDNKYQLRYTGGMVPDVNQLMVKGKGIFVNPVSPSAAAKLRVLYEVAPIGYLIEKAGGKSSDGEKSALDIPITTTEVRSQVAYGAIGEVNRFEELVGVKMYTPAK
jgi:sedoheptulose-bisphosphatase